MKTKNPINMLDLFTKVLGEKTTNFTLPPPIFEIMQCEVIDFNEEEKSLITKVPVLEQWQNPFGTMQGGMIDAAIDNGVGPLSMLVASANMTRTIETKLIKAITTEVGFIYVKSKLVEQKKRRLTFEAEVVDEGGVVNFILE